jgi:hypothetical protein
MREKHRLMVYENTLRAKCLGLNHREKHRLMVYEKKMLRAK